MHGTVPAPGAASSTNEAYGSLGALRLDEGIIDDMSSLLDADAEGTTLPSVLLDPPPYDHHDDNNAADGVGDVASPPLLDDDAEGTSLPPGLLDSSPKDHHDDNEPDALAAPSQISKFIDSVTVPPPAPVLAHPTVPLVPPIKVSAAPTPQRRCSERQRQRLAATPDAKTATQRAVEVKLKWMGLTDDQVNPNTDKKKHCLSKFSGKDKMMAQAALDDLFADKNGSAAN